MIDEDARVLNDDLALPVECHHVIAVIQYDRVDDAAECPLQVGRVVEVGVIILAGTWLTARW